MSVVCPRCHFRFPLEAASQGAFELFHVLRDQYAEAQGLSKIEAKDTLCILFGVSEDQIRLKTMAEFEEVFKDLLSGIVKNTGSEWT